MHGGPLIGLTGPTGRELSVSTRGAISGPPREEDCAIPAVLRGRVAHVSFGSIRSPAKENFAISLSDPPLRTLPIRKAKRGFYRGFSRDVTVSSKVAIGILVVWAVAFPEHAAAVLQTLNATILKSFSSWYTAATGLFFTLCVALAVWPKAGRLKLGAPDDKPEFSRLSWFSMMFGAGIGVGMLTYATGEPVSHFQTNPDIIAGTVESASAGAVRSAYRWSFLHWGFSAWGTYGLCGLSLAFFAHRRGLPLTIRSALAPLFGTKLSGPLGHVIDIVAVVATVLGVAQTLGYGVEQFVAGLSRIGGGEWLTTLGDDGKAHASAPAIMLSLAVIMGASTLSALSGVGKGIKWLSNINLGLSAFILMFFLVFGSTAFALETLGVGIVDYLVSLPKMLVTVWPVDGTPTEQAMAKWQGKWSVVYWAWWIAFAPFVGMFLARISKGRTVREYVLGAILAPSVMCFVWFALAGGTAIDLELSGAANGSILSAGLSDQLYATLAQLSSPAVGYGLFVVVVVLLLTYLVTSADSAILIINTINAAGDEGPKAKPHIIFWGAALAFVVGALLLVGGLQAIKTAMVIGALPFSLVMVLMGVSLVRAIARETE